jgi:hypothetical protein
MVADRRWPSSGDAGRSRSRILPPRRPNPTATSWDIAATTIHLQPFAMRSANYCSRTSCFRQQYNSLPLRDLRSQHSFRSSSREDPTVFRHSCLSLRERSERYCSVKNHGARCSSSVACSATFQDSASRCRGSFTAAEQSRLSLRESSVQPDSAGNRGARVFAAAPSHRTFAGAKGDIGSRNRC